MIFHIINTNIKFKGLKLGEFSVSRKKPIHKGKKRQIKKIIKKNSTQEKIKNGFSIESCSF
jgi:CxxC motif-containing protein